MENLNPENTEMDKDRLLFEEMKDFRKILEKKSKKNKKKSLVLGIINGIMNISVTALAAVIVGITAYYNLQNLATIICGGIIFLFSALNNILGLNVKGYNYKKSSIRYMEIANSVKNMMYLFPQYTRKYILYLLDFFRKEASNIELEIYSKSLIGEVTFGQDIRVTNSDPGITDSPVYRRKSIMNDDDKSLIFDASTESQKRSSLEFFNDPFHAHQKNSFHSKSEHKSEYRDTQGGDVNILKNVETLKDIEDDSSVSIVESKLYKSNKNILNRTMSLPNLKARNVQKE